LVWTSRWHVAGPSPCLLLTTNAPRSALRPLFSRVLFGVVAPMSAWSADHPKSLTHHLAGAGVLSVAPGLLSIPLHGNLTEWPGNGNDRGLLCKPRHAEGARLTTVCASSHGNPEMKAGLEAQAGPNYAHWLFALVYPLVTAIDDALAKSGATDVNILLTWGRNRRYYFFRAKLEELFDTQCQSGEFHRSAVVDARGCDFSAWLHTPRLQWYSASFWRRMRAFSLSLSRRLASSRSPLDCGWRHLGLGLGRLLVLQRNDPKGGAHRARGEGLDRHAWGLERACQPDFVRASVSTFGAQIECFRLNGSVPLHSVASIFSGGDNTPTLGLVAVHGAGLANAIFMRPGAVLVEIDAAINGLNDRSMYQWLTNAIGVHGYKLYLNRAGVRHFPVVTPARMRPSLRNASVLVPNQGNYRQSVTVTPRILDGALRNASAIARGCDAHALVAVWAAANFRATYVDRPHLSAAQAPPVSPGRALTKDRRALEE